MSVDITAVMDAEIEALTREIEASEAWQKREALRAARLLYGNMRRVQISKNVTLVQPAAASVKKHERSGIRNRILEAVDRYFGQSDGPFKTGHLFEAIIRTGLSIPGKDPRNNLSAMLSNSNAFESTPDGWVRSGSALDPKVAGTPDASTSGVPKAGGETPDNRAPQGAMHFAERG